MSAVIAPPSAAARLLDGPARVWALVVAVATGAPALSMAVAFAGDRGTVGAFDRHAMVRIYAWYPDRRPIAHRIADLGGPAVVFLAVVALVAWAYVRKQPRAAVLAALGPALAIVVTEYVLKPTVDRRLLGFVTYPSGHATGAFSVVTVLAVVLLGARGAARSVVRVAVVVTTYAVCVLVAVSLVAAGYHVPTDTIGGAGVAIATVLLVAVGVDAVADRRLTRR
jgi:undecaprenyl-diphosphatase